MAQPVARRNRPQVVSRVALTAGAGALQQHVLDQLPDFTWVLDLRHVSEPVWDAANARWGDTSPERWPWLRQALTGLLEDHLDDLLNHLDTHAAPLALPQQASLSRVSADWRRNRPFLDYPH